MIKLAKAGLLSVALLTTVVAKASKIVTVESPGAKVVNITLADVAEGEVFSILDVEGSKLLTEELSQAETFVKTINFSPLKEGIYFLETKKEKEVNVTPIIIKEKSVSVASHLTKTYKAPKITLDGTVARILVKNFDNASVTITVYSAKGTEYIYENAKDLLIYHAYDFGDLGKGDYTISVTQAGYNFSEEVKF